MKEFYGMVGRTWSKRSVMPSSSAIQLSHSQSMIVLLKSKTTKCKTIVGIASFRIGERREREKQNDRERSRKKRCSTSR